MKRPDEKAAVERAFNNPKFVEDVVRDVSVSLAEEKKIEGFSVVITSYESIHPYNVVAIVDKWGKRDEKEKESKSETEVTCECGEKECKVSDKG